MAVGANAAAGGKRRRRSSKRSAPMADMNMIPFIDVMLVLLVIFMVAAPLLTIGVPVDLPKTGASQINIDQKPLSVTIDDKGRLFLQEKETSIDKLAAEITIIAKQGFDEKIFVRGAAQVNYGRVAEVMSVLQKAGFTKMALVNAPAAQK